MTSLAHRGFVHLGMDVSKDSISVAILAPDRDVAVTDKISSDAESVRRLIKRVGRPSGIWACYEAGPTGYDLYRLLTSMKVRCDVVAPSLIPKGRGDRVKTDKRDSRRLAGLHRAGELTAIAVPDPAEEAVRDLCRTRGDMVEDLTRARNRLTKFLLRHSTIYRGGSNWTIRHERWLSGLHFEDKALAATFGHYRATVPAARHRSRGRRGRPAQLLRHRSLRRDGGPPGRLSGRHPHGRAVPGRRGLRLAALPDRPNLHGLYRPDLLGELDRPVRAARSHHPSRQQSHPSPAVRSGLVLPAPPLGRPHPEPTPSRRHPGHHRPVLESPDQIIQALRCAGRPQERQIRGRHRYSQRAGWLRLGGDDLH